MFKVVEVAEKLKVSKVSVYNKINQNKGLLKPHIKKVKSVTSITNEGFEILEKLFSKDNESKDLHDKDNFLNSKAETQDNAMIIEFKEIYKERIKDLKVQIEGLNKDKENLTHQVQEQTELNKNFQILIKQEQDKVLLLEEQRKPFLKKLFSKNNN